MKTYPIFPSPHPLTVNGQWTFPPWENIQALSIDNFLNESSDHHPQTLVKALYTEQAIHVMFKVTDRFVKCVHTGFQSEVWKDSCVEWFVEPKPNSGYFNFEVNCGGALRVSYVEDPTRKSDGALTKSTLLSPEIGRQIAIYASMPRIVDPEIAEPIEWIIEIKVPITVLTPFIGSLKPLKGQIWRVNFNKCADASSHPHWATWNPISKKNFHRPHEFGQMVFL